MSNRTAASPSPTRTRPQLSAFSNRAYAASPLGPQNRLATPQRDLQPQQQRQQSAARKLTTREEFARGAMNASSALRPAMAGSSARGTSVPNIFAPGASPIGRKARIIATASPSPSFMRPRSSRMSAPAPAVELFVQRIPEPPSDLTGEALAQKIPDHLQARGSVYADQYLSHLVPANFNDEQRRQFFAILDLRRLKVAATEIFAKKDWKLNIMSFAREYDKSRSMVLLRYGLYEFKNVKPSAEVLRRWRAAHGLPDPIDEDPSLDGARQASVPTVTKRKAEEHMNQDSASSFGSPSKSKRRTFTVDDDSDSDRGYTKSTHTKRKMSLSNNGDGPDLPSKLHKSTSSVTKSMFESVADDEDSGTFRTPDSSQQDHKPPATAPAPKLGFLGSAGDKTANLFASAAKPGNKGPASSIFDHLKSKAAKSGASSTANIFGHLSDSSAKNSFVEPDSSDDETEAADAPAKAMVEASGKPMAGSGFLSVNKNTGGLPGTTALSNTASRESTPGKSLFERAGERPTQKPATTTTTTTKQTETPTETAVARPAPLDQTWSAGTPIKFAPAAAASPANVFGAKDSTAASAAAPPLFSAQHLGGLFGAKTPSTPQPSSTSSIGAAAMAAAPNTAPPKPLAGLFGSPAVPAEKKDAAAPKEAAPAPPALGSSHAPSAIFGASSKANTPGLFQGSVAGLFQSSSSAAKEKKPDVSPKPTTTSLDQKTEPTKATQPPPSAIFGPPRTSSNAGLFKGSFTSQDGASTAAAATTKTTAPATASVSATAAPAFPSLFGATKPVDGTPSTGLFGATKPANSTPSMGLFGAAKPTDSTPSTGLFGAAKPADGASSTGLFGAAKPTDSAPSTNLFGAGKPADSVPSMGLFGAMKPADSTPSTSLFGMSKPAETSTPSTGLFGLPKPATSNIFGSSSTTEPKPALGSLFGSAAATTTPSTGIFGSSQPSAVSSAPATGAQPASSIFNTAASSSVPNMFAPASQPQSLFGSQPTHQKTPEPSAPIFSFGASNTVSKPAEPANMFNSGGGAFGSPMKTDQSPAKQPVQASTSNSIFNFGGAPAFPPPAQSNIFGGSGAVDPNQSITTVFGGNNSFSSGVGQVPAAANATQSFNNPFAAASAAASGNQSAAPSIDFNFGGPNPFATQNQANPISISTGNNNNGNNNDGPQTPTNAPSGSMFSFAAGGVSERPIATPRRRGASPAVQGGKRPFVRGGTPSGSSQPSGSFTASQPQQQQQQQQQQPNMFGQSSNAFGQNIFQQQQQQQQPLFGNSQAGGPPTSSGASPSVFSPAVPVNNATATASAASTAPAVTTTTSTAEGDDTEAPLAQINLTSGGPGEEDESVLHEVRAKALKFVAPDKQDDAKAGASPWTTQGLGPLRLLHNKQTDTVRLLLRAEPSGKVALNRAVLAGEKYAASEKYVKITTADASGSGLETWMLQVKTKELAGQLAAKLEEFKGLNAKK